MPHERRNPRVFLWCRYRKIFYRHAVLFVSSVRPPRQWEGACHVNRIITSLGYLSARQNTAVKDAQRGEAGSLTAADCCATHDKYGGNYKFAPVHYR